MHVFFANGKAAEHLGRDQVGQDDLIAALLKGSGYRLGERNLSRSGEEMKKKGRAEAYAWNAICIRNDL